MAKKQKAQVADPVRLRNCLLVMTVDRRLRRHDSADEDHCAITRARGRGPRGWRARRSGRHRVPRGARRRRPLSRQHAGLGACSPVVGWIAPVLLAAAAASIARWLVRRYAPDASGSGVQRVEEVIRGDVVPGVPPCFRSNSLAACSHSERAWRWGAKGRRCRWARRSGICARAFKLRAGDARVFGRRRGRGSRCRIQRAAGGRDLRVRGLLRRFELRAAVATLAACSAALAVMRSLVGDRLVFPVPASKSTCSPDT